MSHTIDWAIVVARCLVVVKVMRSGWSRAPPSRSQTRSHNLEIATGERVNTWQVHLQKLRLKGVVAIECAVRVVVDSSLFMCE